MEREQRRMDGEEAEGCWTEGRRGDGGPTVDLGEPKRRPQGLLGLRLGRRREAATPKGHDKPYEGRCKRLER